MPRQACSRKKRPTATMARKTQTTRSMPRRGSAFIRLERGQYADDAFGNQLVAGRRKMDAVVIAQPLGNAAAIGAVGDELSLIIGDDSPQRQECPAEMGDLAGVNVVDIAHIGRVGR